MAKVSVYNIEGNQVGEMELNDAIFGVEVNEHLVQNVRAHRVPEPVPKYPAAERNLGDRRVQATQDRVQRELLSGQAAA